MLLIYYRTYTTHAFLGFLFGVDDSAVGRNINPLQPLLAGIFRIPERRVKLDPEEIRELFFDATERPTRRPDAGPAGVLLGQEEAAHDQEPGGHGPPHQAARPRREAAAAADRRRVRVVPGQRPRQEGLRPDAGGAPRPMRGGRGTRPTSGRRWRRPTRKPRGGELTAGQKEGNRAVSRRRIVAEHGIGKMKVWRIAAERYRNPDRRHTLIMKNVAGLHNLMYA